MNEWDRRAFAIAPLLLAMGACQQTEVQRIEGTVHLLNIEGGCWVIETAEGRVQPLDLPQQYQREGLAVAARVRDVKDVLTSCQAGTLKQIEKIEERK